MRLLFITQAVDEREPVLGFVVGWLRAFASGFEHISTVCLRKGKYNFPGNVSVYSLDKERGVSRAQCALRFLWYVWKTRHKYDVVFVHMNQEYILLAGLLWRLLGKPVAFWYNHTDGGMFTKIAMRLATVVFHTSPYAFTAGSEKSVRMPAGIPTDRFSTVSGIVRAHRSILYLGRIAPVKGVSTLVEAALELHKRGTDFSLTICGDALSRDAEYEKKVHTLAVPLVAAGKCSFFLAVPNRDAPKVFSAHEIFVNLTPAGNYDKTVLEAAACGALPVVSSPAFRDVFPHDLFCSERNPRSIADAIERVFVFSTDKRASMSKDLRSYVVNAHDTTILVKKVQDRLRI